VYNQRRSDLYPSMTYASPFKWAGAEQRAGASALPRPHLVSNDIRRLSEKPQILMSAAGAKPVWIQTGWFGSQYYLFKAAHRDQWVMKLICVRILAKKREPSNSHLVQSAHSESDSCAHVSIALC